MFVGLDAAVTLDLGSAADTFVGPRWCAADMFIGHGPAVALHGGTASPQAARSGRRAAVAANMSGGAPRAVAELRGPTDMSDRAAPDARVQWPSCGPASIIGLDPAVAPGDARPRQRGGHVRQPQGPAVARDLGSAADMFVGSTAPRWRATSATRRTCPSDPRDLDSAADMFVGPDPRGGPR